MSVEVCHYRLSLRGKLVGSQSLSTHFRGRTALLASRLQLQGGLGSGSVSQRSKVHRGQFFSFAFEEESETPGERRSFALHFDLEAGLVRASRGADTASAPYLTALEDPLGLLYHLRALPPETARLRVPMLGHEVLVERVGERDLETALGARTASVYLLQPGSNYVYVDQAPPHLILLMQQRLEGQPLEAALLRVDEDDEAPPEAQADLERARGSRRRRRRRARRS